MSEVVMPRLSDSMEEGTILTWLKQVGDEVAVGDELVEIETDKANMAYESDTAGTLTEILAQEGETLPIGSPIARIGDSSNGEGPGAGPAGPAAAGDPPPAAEQQGVPPTTSPTGEAEEKDSEAPAAEAEPDRGVDGSDGERVKASPLARRFAQDKGLDLASLHGSGPGGRIVKHDVEEAEGPSSAAPAPSTQPEGAGAAPATGGTAKGEVETREPNKLQQTIARRMAESKATAPHFYLTIEIDMGKAVEARAAIKAGSKEGDVVPSFNDMIVKACAVALREFPKANGGYRDGRFELYSRVNVGVAVAAQDALVVPTIFDADRKSLGEISRDARGLAGKVRDGKISPPELSGGTFSVSNLGMFGIKRFTAVINPPQAAILAVGEMTPRPVVVEGEVAVRPIMELTLSCDHRILYGADAAQFLGRIRERLDNPYSLAL